ncbi:MAG TPA: formate dehydrogenase accessory sulfurtransferase FdhD [Terriglobia bacterium]
MRDTKRVSIVKIEERKPRRIDDDLVMEEPLEIRVNGESVSVTMRTPGHDFDLAVGFLWTEQIINSREEIGTIAYCPDEEQPDLKNIVNVVLVDSRRKLESSRRLWSNSSCGLCGKATLDSIRKVCKPVSSTVVISEDVLCSLPGRLREAQANFERTGGIHAAGLFDALGTLRILREDIGRHNAVDKVLGAALTEGLEVSDAILMVSGRLGFEIAQKAVAAGVPIVASISAPSSLAVELAADFNMTAVGFLRGRSMNIYSNPERIRGSA